MSYLVSKEDAQEKLLAVILVQNSDEVRYAELKIYMHNRYINGKYHWPKTLTASLNLLVYCRGGKRPPVHQYEYRKGIVLTTK